MINDLNYINKLTNQINHLESSASRIADLIFSAPIKSASEPSKSHSHLEQTIAQCIKIEEMCDLIFHQLKTNQFVPRTLEKYQIQGLNDQKRTLPFWLQYVINSEYQLRKKQLDLLALRFFQMHDLRTKKQILKHQRQKIQMFFKRLSIFSLVVQSEETQLKNNLNRFRDHMEETKGLYHAFCQTISQKIEDFINTTLFNSQQITKTRQQKIENSIESNHYLKIHNIECTNHFYTSPKSNFYRQNHVHKHTCLIEKSGLNKFRSIRSVEKYGGLQETKFGSAQRKKYDYRKYLSPNRDHIYIL